MILVSLDQKSGLHYSVSFWFLIIQKSVGSIYKIHSIVWLILFILQNETFLPEAGSFKSGLRIGSEQKKLMNWEATLYVVKTNLINLKPFSLLKNQLFFINISNGCHSNSRPAFLGLPLVAASKLNRKCAIELGSFETAGYHRWMEFWGNVRRWKNIRMLLSKNVKNLRDRIKARTLEHLTRTRLFQGALSQVCTLQWAY